MITNFYKNFKLIKTVNLSIIPREGEHVTLLNRAFEVAIVELDLDAQIEQYNIHLIKSRWLRKKNSI